MAQGAAIHPQGAAQRLALAQFSSGATAVIVASMAFATLVDLFAAQAGACWLSTRQSKSTLLIFCSGSPTHHTS